MRNKMIQRWKIKMIQRLKKWYKDDNIKRYKDEKKMI